MRTRTLAILFISTMAAFTVGTFIAPSNKEVALMHMRDADFGESLKLYAGLQARGDDSISVIVPLINLYIHYGDTNKAIQVLEKFVAEHKHTVSGRKKLAELYKASQRFNDYSRVLEDLQTLSPSVDTLRKLADIYDLLGLYPQERHALERLIASEGYVPQEDDYYKLAIFDEVANRPADAGSLLAAGVETMNYKVGIDTIHLAVQLQLEQGKAGKALSIANEYLHKRGSVSDAVIISSLLQSYGKLDAAYKVTEPYLADMDRSFDLEQQVVSVLLEQNRDDDVFVLLSRQFAANILPAPLASTFIDLAIKRKNYSLIESVIKTTDLQKLPEDALLRYADFAFQNKNQNTARLIRDRLGKEFLQHAQLLSAVLDVAADDSPQAVKAVLDLPNDLIVLPEEKLTVAGILIKYGYMNRACALFDNIPASSIFEILDPLQVASLYLDANDDAKGRQKLEEAQQEKLAVKSNLIDKSLFLLSVGEGDSQKVKQWLADHSSNDINLWSDAYYLAGRYHRDALALEFARRIYSINSTQENLLQLSDALLANHDFAEALRYLKKPAEQGGPARQMFLDGTEQWVGQINESTARGRDFGMLESIITTELAKLNLSAGEKRDFAYLLESAGFHDQAEGYFVELAAGQPFGSHPVDELLGFWDDKLSPAALDWIISRAQASPPPEKAQWLSYLNDAGHPDSVIPLLQQEEKLSRPLTDVYINALLDTHDSNDLRKVLGQAVDEEDSDTDRLEGLAKTAESGSLMTIAEKAWEKIYELEPDNTEAARWLGLRRFDEHRYVEAGTLLKKYLDSGEDDYRTNYAYAEVLQETGKKQNSEPYYKRALEQISDIPDKTPDMLADEARLLNLNGKNQQAINLFRKLLAQDPQNKDLRADLAETLIQDKQLNEASVLLSY